jgi:micrococcal nuclease
MHRTKYAIRRLSIITIRVSVLIALAFVFILPSSPYLKQIHAEFALQEARVIAVNDGDTVTLLINGKKQRTRLIGIDAPELGQRPWGERAKEQLAGILRQNRWMVYVETDSVRIDKYDRLLVYLWTKENEFINERMLNDGYAVLFTIQPNSRHLDRFKKAQRNAREKKIGIWGPEGLQERPFDYRKAHPRN